MNKFLPLILITLFLTGCIYFNTVYNARTAYNTGYESYRKDLRQSSTVSRETEDHFQRAVQKGKKILTEYPDSKYVAEAYLLIGKSYYYLDKPGLARDYLNDLNSNFPNSSLRGEARLFLGKAYFQLEEYPLARHEFESIIENSDQKSLRAQAWLALSDLEKAEGNSDLMLEAVQSAIAIAEDNEVKADAAWRTGQWAMDNNQYDEAERFFNQAADFTRKPQFDRQIRVQMVTVYRKQGKYDRAMERLQSWLAGEEYQEFYPQLEIERGLIYEQTGDTVKAKSSYQYVTQNYPNTVSAATGYYYLGKIAFEQMEYDSAKVHFDNTVRIGKENRFITEAREKSRSIGQLQKLETLQKTHRDNFIQTYIAKEHPEMLESKQDTVSAESDSLMEKEESTVSDAPVGSESGSEFLSLGQGEEEETAAFTFDEIRPWLMKQDSIQGLDSYLEKRYAIAELFIFDLNKPHRGLAICDSLLNIAPDTEFKAKALLLQAYTYQNVLNRPERAENLVMRVRENYPDARALIEYDGKDLIEKPTTPSVVSDLKQRYNTADSLIVRNQYSKARELLESIYRSYPESKYGPKALYVTGWLYENKLMVLDSAVSRYQQFRDQYPQHEMSSTVSARLRDLTSIQTALATPAEPDTGSGGVSDLPVTSDTTDTILENE
ncbi:MAG: tetratricopeptide repeat protein [Candidatus Marinimicrobia bacterium]|nr:tetratricopeptide repeat protein [Candidatus Neomarinimicrobiota bacterium]MCF7880582.1 tetratricopeptide repeat protein [Candidatus Neomarinimicrobiota bacterium]